jgi:hypothetical protein
MDLASGGHQIAAAEAFVVKGPVNTWRWGWSEPRPYGVGVRPRRPIKPYGAKFEVLDLCAPGSLGTRNRPVRIPSARVV